MTTIGIHDLELATTHYVVDLGDLAESRGIDPGKYKVGIGQEEMSFPAPDEDVVTMGAAAALPLLERNGTDGIRTLLFATESGVDHSKAAGVFVHRLLGLAPQVRVVEFKQACYGGTAAVQAAIGIVSRSPEEKVLVIASDVARYELNSPGEATQGAGAVAMLIAAGPGLVEIEPVSGVHTADVDDFWRPNDSTTAVVDGRLSVTVYLEALMGAWHDLSDRGGPEITSIDRLLYHQPFTKMAVKAQRRLAQRLGVQLDDRGLETGSVYNRRLGNTYTASLYAGLVSLLHHEDDLAGRRVGLFSYGSGAVSELLTGVVQPGYVEPGAAGKIHAMLDARVPLQVEEYCRLHATELPSDTDVDTPRVTRAPFRFAGIKNRARRYERTEG